MTTCWHNFGLKSSQFSCLGFTGRGHSHFQRRRSAYLLFLTGNSQTSQGAVERCLCVNGTTEQFSKIRFMRLECRQKFSTFSRLPKLCRFDERDQNFILPSASLFWSVPKALLVMHFFVKQSNRVPWHGEIYDTHFWLLSDSLRSFQAWNKGSDPLSKRMSSTLKLTQLPGSLLPLFKTADFLQKANFSFSLKKKVAKKYLNLFQLKWKHYLD